MQLTCAGAADAVTAAECRRALDRWLQAKVRGVGELRDDIILGVNEALANCVEHAYRGHQCVGTMRLQARYDAAAESLTVCVSDRGSWHWSSPRPPEDPHASRGILLMRALADHCAIQARPDGTTVRLDYSTAPQPAGQRQ
ncbi:ATP-binding protein [Mycobacterium bourgelatii]|uniref:Anti-sigma regulatory factor n=1 Tax=Mycobacterium bourgelatii TaxID=1273442 RepID=A0A7I9YYH6_MYCBU|nr:ATP-binding protein [Mycobacterium bourgelatii]MCV6976344.1 ATP-binding protein [Mycobacterium bourgelatii]GFG93784.1 anti-sigma regulatory factor [Mycobacterium bourgelatii]